MAPFVFRARVYPVAQQLQVLAVSQRAAARQVSRQEAAQPRASEVTFAALQAVRMSIKAGDGNYTFLQQVSSGIATRTKSMFRLPYKRNAAHSTTTGKSGYGVYSWVKLKKCWSKLTPVSSISICHSPNGLAVSADKYKDSPL
jgi:hypothetical protein